MPRPRSRRRLPVVLAVLAGLLILTAVLLLPYANARLARALADLFENGLLLKAEHLEVDLLGRRAEARNLRAIDAYAPIASVDEIRLEGVNLYALVFGVDDASLAARFTVRGVRPGAGPAGASLERAEITRLSGPFPGLLSLVREPYGRAFGPAALRMRAGVLSVDKLAVETYDFSGYLGSLAAVETRDRSAYLDGLAAVDFSLSGHTFAVLRGVMYDDKHRFGLCSVGVAVMGRRVNPDPLLFNARRFEDPEAERVRQIASGISLEGAFFHTIEVAGQVGLTVDLLTVSGHSDKDSARFALEAKGLKGVNSPSPPLTAFMDGDLSGGLLLEAGGPDAAMVRQSLRAHLEKSDPRHVFAAARLEWEQQNPRPDILGRSLFPTLEPTEPALLRAMLQVEQRGGLQGRAGTDRFLPAEDPDAAYLWFAQTALGTLGRELPKLFTEDSARQVDEFLQSGGEFRMSLEPSAPLPLLFAPDALMQRSPDLNWKQSLNGVEAK